MQINLDELRKRNKYINETHHPLFPLVIFNYNQNCQFEKAWDEYSSMARGLITDEMGAVIVRPFSKFFNLGETEQTKMENLPLEMPKIYEKLDGSLGLLYWDTEYQPCIATRGSFMSDQAIWATSWIQGKIKQSDVVPGCSYLFEIIYPDNRIVVNYGNRNELVLLAVINNENGTELDHIKEAERLGFSYAKQINKHLIELQEYVKTMPSSEEGFVLVYNNGLRVKMKGDEYVRLHKIITGFSTIGIWECLRAGNDIEKALVGVPDEFFDWVKKKKDELLNNFAFINSMALRGYDDILSKNLPDRKSQALEIQALYSPLADLIFGLLDGRDSSDKIWRRLRPKFELPFKDEQNLEDSTPLDKKT